MFWDVMLNAIMFQLGWWSAVAFHHHMVERARRRGVRWPP